ncbi:MAG: carbohydrate kinase family protein [Actinomycetia bacterium]|nr:carbohydrate kinase family protein [Actinomycetes bacterium]
MKRNCLVIGDLNVDLIVADINGPLEKGSEVTARNHFLDIGGSGGVFAAVLSELGIKTFIISKIGNDFFGDYLMQKLKSHGAGIDKILIEEGMDTGVTISLSYAEDNIQISSVEMVKKFNIGDIVFEGLKNIKHVHFSSYYMMDGLQDDYIKIITTIKKRYGDITFSMDTNDDPSGKWGGQIYNILPHIDIFLINKKEALRITKKDNIDDALEKLSKTVKTVIIKLGKKGYIAKDNGNIHKGDPLNVDFKDSTGAGDNFDAGFIYGFLNNMGPEKSLRTGNICGAKSVEYLGGAGTKEKFNKINKLIRKTI